ncbi:MAG: calcium-binding protein, partial [Verrucomicrobia bacterium]|nr:calcium-binding protein [Verrucomicrobiota bacterium]
MFGNNFTGTLATESFSPVFSPPNQEILLESEAQFDLAPSIGSLLSWINDKLSAYGNGDHAESFTPGDLQLGGILKLLAPKIAFDINKNDTTFTGTVKVSSDGGTVSIGSTITGSFSDSTTDGDSVALKGDYDITAKSITLTGDQLDLDISGFVSLHASSFKVKSTTTGSGGSAVADVQFGATGVEVFFGNGPLRNGADLNPNAMGFQLTNGSIGLLSRSVGGATASYAFKATGDVKLLGFADLTLEGTGWTAASNTLGDLSGVNSVLVDTGSSTVSLDFAANLKSFSGTATLTTPVAELKGTFGVAKDGTNILLAGQNIEVFVGDRKDVLNLTDDVGFQISSSSFGAILKADKTYAFDASGTVTVLGIPGVTATGTFDARKNTIGENVNQPVTVDGVTSTINVAAGVSEFGGAGVSLTVSGTGFSQTLTGDFSFSQSLDDDGGKVVSVAAKNVLLTFGDGTNNYLSLSNGQGAFIAVTGGIAGRLSGDVALTNVPNVTLSGTLGVEFNNTASAVNRNFHVGGVAVGLSLAAGQFFRFAGTNVQFVVLGQALRGNVAFERVQNNSSQNRMRVAITNAVLAIGDGSSDLLTVSVAEAGFIVTNHGIAGRFDGAAAVMIPGVTFSSNLTVLVNNTGDAFSETIPLGAGSVMLQLDAGTFVSATASALTLTVRGFGITGNFTFEAVTPTTGPKVLGIAVTGGTANLATGSTNVVSLTNIHGAMMVTTAGIAADLTITPVFNFGTITLTGTISLQLNTTNAAVQRDFVVGSETANLNLTAGPYVRVAVLNGLMTVGNSGGSPQLNGNFFFEQARRPDNSLVTRLGMSGISISFSGQALKNGEGGFIVSDTGIAGIVSGEIDLSVTGGSVAGRLGLRINKTGGAVDETISVGGRDILIKFSAAETDLFSFFAESLAFNVGNFVTIEGSFVFTSVGGKEIFAGDNLSLFLGNGPARLDSGEPNPLASGVLLSNARVGLIRFTDGSFAMVAEGTVSILGVNGITLTGTATIRVNTSTQIVDETLEIPNSSSAPIQVKFTSTDVVKTFEAANAQLSVLGQMLTGNFSFDRVTSGAPTGTLRVGATGVSLTLGDAANNIVNVTGGSGAFLLTSAGLAGDMTATVNLAFTGVTFGTTLKVAINTTNAAVSTTVNVGSTPLTSNVAAGPYLRVQALSTTATILGQTLQGNFYFEQSTNPSNGNRIVRFAATNVTFNIAAGGSNVVSLTNGQGSLVATVAGLAGVVSGTVTITPPQTGISFSGNFALSINQTNSAIEEQIQVGDTVTQISLPSGPYLRIDATNATLTIAGQTLSGDFAFEQFTNIGSQKIIRVGMANVTIGLGSAGALVNVTDAEGFLLITPDGVAGTLAAFISVNVPGVSFSGAFSLALNRTGGTGINETFLVGATPVVLVVPAGEYVRVTGTGVNLNVLGQTLTGNFRFERVTVASTTITQLHMDSVTLSLGGTSISPIVSVTNGSGDFLLTSNGIAGRLSLGVAVNLPNVTLSATTLRLRVNTTNVIVDDALLGASDGDLSAGPFLRVEAIGGHLGVAGQILDADFVFEQTIRANGAKIVRVAVANGVAKLGGTSGSEFLTVTGGSGVLVLTPAGVAGEFSGGFSLGVSSFSLVATQLTVQVNNTTNAINESIVLGVETKTLVLQAGPFIRVVGTGVALTVGGQTLTGDFSFEQYTVAGNKRIRVSAANISLSLGDGLNNFLSVTNGSGNFVLRSTGFFGSLSGSVALNLPGVTLTGTLGVKFNTITVADSGGNVSETFFVNGTSTTLTLPAGNYVRVEGTGLSLTVDAGGTVQTLTGNFVFDQITTTTGGETVTRITASNVALALGDGANDLVRVTGGSGFFLITSDGIAGTFTGAAQFNVPGVSLGGTFTVNFKTYDAIVNETFDGGSLSILTSGKFVEVAVGDSTTPATMTIAGQDIKGAFTFSQATSTTGEKVVKVSVTSFAITITDGTTTFASATGSGALYIDRLGVAADFTVTAAIDFTALKVNSGTMRVQINTRPVPVSQTIGADVLDLPAGTFIGVAVTGANVTITAGSAFTVTGNFLFDQQKRDDGTFVRRVAMSNVSVTIAAQTMINGVGAFVIKDSGVAGFVNGTVSGGGGGASVAADLGLRVNNTGSTVDETVSLNGSDLHIVFTSNADVFQFIVSNFSLNVANFVTITGKEVKTDGTGFSGTGLDVFIGQGPGVIMEGSLPSPTRSINPSARGLLLTNAAIDVIAVTGGYAVYASGTLMVLGVSGLEFSGTVTVEINQDTAADHVVGTHNVTAGRKFFGGSNVTFKVAGVSLTGSFTFDQIGTASTRRISFTMTGVSFTLGEGTTPPVSVINASGAFLMSSAGIAGELTIPVGDLTLTTPGGTFSGGFTLKINTGALAVNETVAAVTVNVPAGPYVQLSANGATLIIGTQIVSGNFAFEQFSPPQGGGLSGSSAAKKVRVAATNVSVTLPGIGITEGTGFFILTGTAIAGRVTGKVAVTVDPTIATFNASFAFEINTGSTAVAESFTAGAVNVSLNLPGVIGGYLRMQALNATLTIAGQTISGDFGFTKNSTDLLITVANLSVALGDGTTNFVTVTNGFGQINITGLGVAETLSATLSATVNVTVPGLTIGFDTGGSFSLALGSSSLGKFIRVNGTAIKLTVAGQSITGSLDFEQLTMTNGLKFVKVSMPTAVMSFLGDVSSLFDVNISSAAFLITAGGFAGEITVTPTLSFGGASFTGTFKIRINTSALAVNQVFEAVDGTKFNLSLPGGPYLSLSGIGVTLTVGTQTMTVDVAFEQTVNLAGQKRVRIGVSNASFSISDGVTTFASLTNGAGLFVLSNDGLAGALSGTVTLNVPGVTFSGTFGVAFNNTTKAVNESLNIGGSTVTLNLAKGPYLRIAGTGVEVRVAGQVLAGDFAFEKTATEVRLNIANVTLKLGDGSTDLVTVTNGSGFFIVRSAAGADTGGIAGTFSADIALNLPGITVTGTFGVTVNNTNQIVNTIPAGPYVKISVTGGSLVVAGQTITGGIEFEQITKPGGAKFTKIKLTEVSLSIGDGTKNYVEITHGNGLILATTGGVAADFSATLALTNLPDVSLGGGVRVRINTLTRAVSESFTATNGDVVALTLPGGPYLRVETTSALTMTVMNQTFSANFAFEQVTKAGGQKIIRVGVSGLNLSFGDGANTFASITGGAGLMVINNSGLAAGVTGTIAVNLGAGVSVSGTFTLIINNRALPVSERFTVGGQTLQLIAPAGPFIRIAGTGVVVTIGGQTLSGDVSFERQALTVGFTTRVKFSNVGLRLGNGGTDYVVVSNGHGDLQMTAGVLTGEIAADVAVNVPGVTFTGTFKVAIGAGSLTVSGTDVTLAALGQSLRGSFTFAKHTTTGGASVISATVSGLRIGLGDGTTEYVTVSNGTGALLIQKSGIAGRFSADVAVNIPGVVFTGSLGVAINTGTADVIDPSLSLNVPGSTGGPYLKVEGSAQLTIQGVTMGGVFAFEQIKNSTGGRIVRIGVTGLNFTLSSDGTTLATLTNGNGSFVVTPQGFAGGFNIHGAFNLPNSASFTGDFGFQINTAATAINQTMTVDGAPVILNVPAGPYLRISVTNFNLNIAGNILHGDFYFDQATRPTSSTNPTPIKVTRIAALNVSFSGLGNAIKSASGALIIKPGGFAGVLTGEVDLSAGGVSLGGSLGLAINKTGGAVDETITVNGSSITVRFGPTEGNVFKFFASDLSLNISDFVTIEGSLVLGDATVSSVSAKTFAGQGIDIFMGSGPYKNPDGSINPNAIGVLLKNATLGLVKFTDGTYALDATGDLAFVGLDGLTISATGARIRINDSGRAVNTDLSIPNSTQPPVQMRFLGVERVMEFKSHITLNVLGAFRLEGDFSFARKPNASVQVVIAGATVGITVSGTEVFSLSGSAAFTISSGDGFKLQNFSLNGFTLFGIGPTSTTAGATLQFPTADLTKPFAGQLVDKAVLNTTQHYIDVTFNDTGTSGLNETTITDDAQEFELKQNGIAVPGIILNGKPTKVVNTASTYRYTFAGNFLTDGDITVDFIAQSFATNAGLANFAQTQGFVLATSFGGKLVAPGPTATISNPNSGGALSAQSLNTRQYIDVTFDPRGDSPINKNTVDGHEFKLVGSGIADVKLDADGIPILVGGTPLFISGTTWRYYLQDSDKTNTTGLFKSGEVQVVFINPTSTGSGVKTSWGWTNQTGTQNVEKTDRFTLDASAQTGATAGGPVSLGPLSLQGPRVTIEDVGFKDGLLVLTIGIGVDRASLAFGGGSGFTADLLGVFGTFDIGVDAFGLLGGNVNVDVPGKFSLSVASLTMTVPNAFIVTADGIRVTYDPAGAEDQKIIEINSAVIAFPRFEIQGSISPFDPDGNGGQAPIPGLVVRKNGFSLGVAELAYGIPPPGTVPGQNQTTATKTAGSSSGASLKFGSILELDDIRIGVQNFSMTFGGEVTTNGSIYVATGGAKFFPGKAFNMTISDRNTADDSTNGIPNTEALRVQLDFNNDGSVKGFQFKADTLTIQFSSFLKITAVDFFLDTSAAADKELVAFKSIGAQLTVGTLSLGGEMRNFAFLGDGTFKTKAGFGVFLSVGGASGDSFKWPSWLPIKINALGITWTDVTNHPEDFTIVLSASVEGLKGMSGLTFSGSIEGVKIKPSLLLEGKFPITDIASIGVSISGKMFGGEITAGLIGGIIRLDSGGKLIGDTDDTTPVVDRVFFVGVQGGFKMPGLGGLTIRLALSELGPLGVFINASVPGGILLEPNTGLSINDFAAGVEFFKSLPDIENPTDLRGPAFDVPTTVTADSWLTDVKGQVVLQYNAVKANPNLGGFLAAFTAPMTITGSAKLFTIYASKEAFNGQVIIKISTDGKILIGGKLNFAADNISLSAKLYANLTKIASGNATVLFLADVPDQIRLLTIYGKLKMGFRNAEGNEVTFDTVGSGGSTTATTLAPTAVLNDPLAGSIDVNTINSRTFSSSKYIDVSYAAPNGANLDYAKIFDTDQEFTLTLAGGTAPTLNGVPVPIITQVTNGEAATYSLEVGNAMIDGVSTRAVVLKKADGSIAQDSDDHDRYIVSELSSSESADDLLIRGITASGTNRFRYFVTSGTFDRGTYTATFTAGGIKNVDVASGGNSVTGANNADTTETFKVEGSTAVLLNPGVGSAIDVNVVNGRHYLDVTFTASGGRKLDFASIEDFTPEFTLAGAGIGTVKLDDGQSPLKLSGATDTNATYRYWITGEFAATGTLTVTALAGGWSFMSPAFTGTAPTFTLSPSGSNLPTYIDVTFPDATTGFNIDSNSVLDLTPEFTITKNLGTANWNLSLDPNLAPIATPVDPVTLVAPPANTWRFFLKTTSTVTPTGDIVVTVNFNDGSWAEYDPSGAAQDAPTHDAVNFRANGALGYVDIFIRPSAGNSLTGGTPSVTFGGLGATTNSVTQTGTASMLGEVTASSKIIERTYRIYFQNKFALGDATLNVAAGQITDDVSNANIEFSGAFQVSGSTADVTNPPSGTIIGNGVINGWHYLEVTFRGSSGHAINPATINGGEIILKDSAGNVITLGAPVRVEGTDRWQYGFTQNLAVGKYTVEFVAGTWSDNVGISNLATTQTFRVEQATAVLADGLGGKTIDRSVLNGTGGYIDVTFTPVFGRVLDLSSIDGNEFTLTGANSENVVFDAPTRIGTTNTFRYTITSGSFDAGVVTVTFTANSWQDKSTDPDDTTHNNGAASVETIKLLSSSPKFFIELTGGVELQAAGLTSDPLFKIEGRVTFEADLERNVMTLDLSGELFIIKLGTVGATAGRFVLDLSGGLAEPQLWGVMTLQTNFSVLEPYGLFLYASGTLQINTTGYEKTETITLRGIGDGGTDVTRTFVLAPHTFSIELVGQALIKIPGTDTELFRLNGGFFMKISDTRFELFATAELSFGIGSSRITYAEARGLLVVVITPTQAGEVIGVAGTFRIGASAGLGLPNIGSVFEVSGSVTVMFNTTLATQTFTIPDSFLPLLREGEPRSIKIFKAKPKLDGTEDTAALAKPYIVATIQAELKIKGFLTLTGFLQIAADTGGVLVTGAVGGDMPFLGALTGIVNFNAYTDDPLSPGGALTPGVVGRIALTFRANRIPGLELTGDLVVEINTYTVTETVTTFDVDDVTGTFKRTGGVIDTKSVDIAAGVLIQFGGSFKLGGFLVLDGKFAMSYTGTSLQVGATATLKLDPLGQIAISGDLIIDGSGLIARIDFALDSSFGSGINLGFSASLHAQLELNTSTATRTYTSLVSPFTIYSIESGFHLRINGTFNLWFASATGIADIRINSSGIQIYFNVSLGLGGAISVNVEGFAGIYTGTNKGMVLSVTVRLDLEIADSVFEIHAGGTLKLNTTGITRNGIAPGFVLALNGQVKLLGVLNFNASFNLVVSAGGEWQVDFNANVSFFGIATIYGGGYFDSKGNFDITLSGRIILGSNDWGIRLSASVHIVSKHFADGTFYFLLSVSGSAEVRAFGITFAGIRVGVTFSVGTPFGGVAGGEIEVVLSLYVSVTIDFGLFDITIGGTVRFSIGTITLPKPSFLVGNGATTHHYSPNANINGPIYLLMGDLATQRGFSTTVTSEGYLVEVLNQDGTVGSDPSYHVRVTGLGRTQEFFHVTKVYANGGSGNDSIAVTGGAIPVELTGGTGNDTIIYDGTGNVVVSGNENDDVIQVRTSGTATLNGGDDNDQITFNGGGTGTLNGDGGNDQLFGSSGSNTLNGGDGNDEIYGNGGVDTITGGTGSDKIFLTFSGLGSTVAGGSDVGGADLDELTLTATGGNDNIIFDVSGGGLRISAGAVGDNATAVRTTGIEVLKFDASVGRDTLSVKNLKGSGLKTGNINLGVASPGDGVADTIIFDGTSGDDTFTGSIVSATDMQLVETGGATYHILNSLRAEGDTLIINGLAGDDTLTFAAVTTSNPDYIAVRLFGGDNNDTLIGTPYADYLDGGAGTDTFTGREGLDTFVDAGAGNILVETFNVDVGLFGNRFVVGSLSPMLTDPFWPVSNPVNSAAPAPAFNRLRDAGDNWLTGATVEDTGGIFSTATLTGG